MRRFHIVIIITLSVLALVACGETATVAGSAGGSSNSATATPIQHFKVGQVVNVSNTWQITISSFAVVKGDEFTQPQSGNQFVAFAVTFKNISKSEQEVFGSADWKLKDATGQAYDSTYVPNQPQEPSGKVESGETQRGTIAYEVPATQKQFTLAYQGSFLSTGQVIWNLSL